MFWIQPSYHLHFIVAEKNASHAKDVKITLFNNSSRVSDVSCCESLYQQF